MSDPTGGNMPEAPSSRLQAAGLLGVVGGVSLVAGLLLPGYAIDGSEFRIGVTVFDPFSTGSITQAASLWTAALLALVTGISLLRSPTGGALRCGLLLSAGVMGVAGVEMRIAQTYPGGAAIGLRVGAVLALLGAAAAFTAGVLPLGAHRPSPPWVRALLGALVLAAWIGGAALGAQAYGGGPFETGSFGTWLGRTTVGILLVLAVASLIRLRVAADPSEWRASRLVVPAAYAAVAVLAGVGPGSYSWGVHAVVVAGALAGAVLAIGTVLWRPSGTGILAVLGIVSLCVAGAGRAAVVGHSVEDYAAGSVEFRGYGVVAILWRSTFLAAILALAVAATLIFLTGERVRLPAGMFLGAGIGLAAHGLEIGYEFGSLFVIGGWSWLVLLLAAGLLILAWIGAVTRSQMAPAPP